MQVNRGQQVALVNEKSSRGGRAPLACVEATKTENRLAIELIASTWSCRSAHVVDQRVDSERECVYALLNARDRVCSCWFLKGKGARRETKTLGMLDKSCRMSRTTIMLVSIGSSCKFYTFLRLWNTDQLFDYSRCCYWFGNNRKIIKDHRRRIALWTSTVTIIN